MLFLLIPALFFSQNFLQPDEFLWSKDRKLQKEDYKLITHDPNVHVKSSISFSYHLRGFSVFNANFNKNIINKFSSNASSFNPDAQDIPALLDYQQLNFDLCEVYARKMRKELLIHKNKLWKGFDHAEEMFNNLTAEYMKTQAIMNEETGYGIDAHKVENWKLKVENDLQDLSDFDYNNTSKIKIKKSSKEEV